MKKSELRQIIKEEIQKHLESKTDNALNKASLKLQKYIEGGGKGDLDLRNTKITQLPQGLKVGGDLDLRNTKITQLPQGLKVGGNLHLENTKITQLPQDLKVGEYLYLQNTPLSKTYTKEQVRAIQPGFYILKDKIRGVEGNVILGLLSEFPPTLNLIKTPKLNKSNKPKEISTEIVDFTNLHKTKILSLLGIFDGEYNVDDFYKFIQGDDLDGNLDSVAIIVNKREIANVFLAIKFTEDAENDPDFIYDDETEPEIITVGGRKLSVLFDTM
jgi:hypothetical protein